MHKQTIEENLIEGFPLIPPHMHSAVKRYVMYGIPMGSFGTALFANDFMKAVGKADSLNRKALYNWSLFIYNYVPNACHGSYEKVKEWIGHQGMKGLEND